MSTPLFRLKMFRCVNHAFLARDGILHEKPVRAEQELEEDWEAVLLSEDGHDTIWDEFKHGVLEH